MLSNLDSGDAAADLEAIRAYLAPVQESLNRVLPHLRFASLGDATEDGSFYFTRDEIRGFRYENLSGGEKAVFDLLLDFHVAATELGSPLICIDEPEIHLNPAVQASVLIELMGLLPDGSQLWIATHSVGMIRKAFDIAAGSPSRVAFWILDRSKEQRRMFGSRHPNRRANSCGRRCPLRWMISPACWLRRFWSYARGAKLATGFAPGRTNLPANLR